MKTKTNTPKCILVIVVQGFDEVDTIDLISSLRQAGLCVKSIGVTSGLVNGAQGICLMPDLTFSDLDHLIEKRSVSIVVLPENKQCLSKLETDPRLYHFLRHILMQGNHIVVGTEGMQFLTKISDGAPELFRSNNDLTSLLLLREQGESIKTLARNLLYRMGQPIRL